MRSLRRESLVVQGTEMRVFSEFVDLYTYVSAYIKGYQGCEGNYPVPAHRYDVLLSPHSVEIVMGLTKEWYPNVSHTFQGPYLDCETVYYYTREIM